MKNHFSFFFLPTLKCITYVYISYLFLAIGKIFKVHCETAFCLWATAATICHVNIKTQLSLNMSLIFPCVLQGGRVGIWAPPIR